MDASVTFALVLNLADAHVADLLRVVHVRAAARLIIDIGDADGANIAGAARRLHRHRAHQFRTFVELDFRDRAELDRVCAGDEFS